jgi:hypothetical protein
VERNKPKISFNKYRVFYLLLIVFMHNSTKAEIDFKLQSGLGYIEHSSFIETYLSTNGDFELGVSRALNAGFSGVSFKYKYLVLLLDFNFIVNFIETVNISFSIFMSYNHLIVKRFNGFRV